MKLPEPKQKENGKWLVQVQIDGKRRSKEFETKEEAEGLLARVNQIIKFYITGDDGHDHEGGCSGHCHTCGGCH